MDFAMRWGCLSTAFFSIVLGWHAGKYLVCGFSFFDCEGLTLYRTDLVTEPGNMLSYWYGRLPDFWPNSWRSKDPQVVLLHAIFKSPDASVRLRVCCWQLFHPSHWAPVAASPPYSSPAGTFVLLVSWPCSCDLRVLLGRFLWEVILPGVSPLLPCSSLSLAL